MTIYGIYREKERQEGGHVWGRIGEKAEGSSGGIGREIYQGRAKGVKRFLLVIDWLLFTY